VYAGCLVSAGRVLTGGARLAAIPSAAMVLVVLAFCGWAIVLAALVAGLATWRAPRPASVVPLPRPRTDSDRAETASYLVASR
jgi:hypothetical protein